MPRTIKKTVFKFDELTPLAKENARDWWRDCENQDSSFDLDSEDKEMIANILGIEFKQKPVRLMNMSTRYEPAIHFSGFSNQGDGASFEGYYAYAKGAPKKIRGYAPTDTELHRIADELQTLQRREFYRIEARISQSGSYYHAYTMSIDAQLANGDDCHIAGTSDAIAELMRDFANWMYRQLEAQYEYIMSDEHVDDSIRINAYEFDEYGKII